jgi:fused signal recognition particle receptor
VATILEKWKNGLQKTRNQAFGRLTTLLGGSEINHEAWEVLEDTLIQADMGHQTASSISAALKKTTETTGITTQDAFNLALAAELRRRLTDSTYALPAVKPAVILVVGVNGSGKTTSIAKLGANYQSLGKSVMFAAADTFRAAAVDQLKEWGQRLAIPVIAGQENADPGAVVFDAVSAATSKETDVLLIDTAGRLHTRYNLMEELKKVYRVCGKALSGAPHAVFLVLDATTGQNAFQQAKVFKEAVQVDGIILAKLDTSAKGGMVFAIQSELHLPIYYTGLGEGIGDFSQFNPDDFVRSIIGS